MKVKKHRRRSHYSSATSNFSAVIAHVCPIYFFMILGFFIHCFTHFDHYSNSDGVFNSIGWMGMSTSGASLIPIIWREWHSIPAREKVQNSNFGKREQFGGHSYVGIFIILNLMNSICGSIKKFKVTFRRIN